MRVVMVNEGGSGGERLCSGFVVGGSGGGRCYVVVVDEGGRGGSRCNVVVVLWEEVGVGDVI